MRLALLFLILLAGCQPAQPVDDRPNIILLMSDDQGWGDAGYMGHPYLKTPNLDAMAANGLRFDRFYAASAVCSPTRASVLTGRHPLRQQIFGANSGKLKDEEIALSELLHEAGYRTGFFGKWHLGSLTTEKEDSNRGGPGSEDVFTLPASHGFDVSFATEAKTPTYDPLRKPKDAPPSWWAPVDAADAIPYGTAYWDTEGKEVTENLEGDDSRIIVDRAVDFIREVVSEETPFFVVLWFHAPHLPVVAGPEHTALYEDLDPYSQHYFGSISAIDDQIGRLRGLLQELGEHENTMMWYSADNGPEGQAGDLPIANPNDGAVMGDLGHSPPLDVSPGTANHLRGRKRDLYEGGIRVPTVLEWPAQVESGTATNVLATSSDYLPTIVDLLGLDFPAARPLDGVSLAPVITGNSAPERHEINFEFNGRLALISHQYKLIAPSGVDFNEASLNDVVFEFYDLHSDEGELNNLIDVFPDSVEAMKTRLASWRASVRNSYNGFDYVLE